MDKIIVKIKDNNCSHEPLFFKDTQNISFITNKMPGGDIKILSGDIVIYTNSYFNKIDPSAKKNIALLMESPELCKEYYDYIEKNNKKFDIVLTFYKKLLDKGENYKFNAYGTSWLNETYINIWSKSKLCSFIVSNKKITSGHKLRHTILNLIRDRSINFIDIYGGNYNKLSFTKTKAFEYNHSPSHISNEKILGLKDYMFSIVIENSNEDYMFTEKIIDCFLSGTIPIYWGCPSINKFFNENGILKFNNTIELLNILKSITKDKYDSIMPYIKENFETAKQYINFKINEKHILNL